MLRRSTKNKSSPDFAFLLLQNQEPYPFFTKGMYDLLPAELGATLPTHPDNLAAQYVSNDLFWGANYEELNECWQDWVAEKSPRLARAARSPAPFHRNMQGGRIMRLTLFPALFLAVAFFLIPVGIMFYQGMFDPEFTLKQFDRFFTRGAYVRIFLNPVKISVVVGMLCVLIGYPIAYFIVRRPPQWRPILLFLVLVPMWMSVLVRTYAWMVLLGREGLINMAMI
ncbi:hypothetical protein SAMN05444000_102252 [Shimia gijangensis]|uniref:ABC transmembrane type-1 domain-containing protein n=1 Tax=Shimia gijangensis TaxID=1470563 RepID=A0A1M6D7U5_9RHOB|nr:hypothetical protein [Shimia gijangensis]SHI69297.1 hypothetical protein SAMN05444000_102252 [Shimia gijangensis]